MKKIYVLSSSLLLAFGLNAQIWSEDFEGGTFPPTGWSMFDNGEGPEEEWEASTTAHNGTGAAFLSYEDAGVQTEDWLVTGQISLTATNSELRFFTRQQYEDDYSTIYQVRVSTASATNPADFTLVAQWDEDNLTAVYNTYEEKVVNLAAYDGDQVYIAFVMIQDNGDNWYIDDVSIDDGPPCPIVSLLTLDDVNATTADFSWTAGSSETSWNIEYGEAGFTPGSGTADVVTGTPEYQLTDLTGQTAYEFYVQADCGGSESSWVGPFSFSTTCEATITTLPWTEDFEGSDLYDVPCGWTVNDVNNDDITWMTYDYEAASGTNALYIEYNSDEDMNDWAFTPEMVLQAGTSYQLSFNLIGSSTIFPEQLTIFIGSDNTTGAMTTQLLDFPAIVNDEFEYQAVNFTVPANGSYYVGFHGHSDADMFFMAIDDVTLDLSPACPQPSAIVLDDVSDDEATFTWTAGNTETDWNIEYGEAGFTPGSGTTDVATGTPEYTAEGLTAETDYEFYVQANCGGDESAWVGPFAFSTLCVAPVITTLPWTENFDGVTAPEVPCGWIVEDANDDEYSWGTDEFAPQSGTNSLIVYYNMDDPSEAMNDWIYTPELVLQAGTSYRLTFGSRIDVEAYPENLEVLIGTDQDVAAMTTPLLNLPNMVNEEYVTQHVDFTVPANGSYYIGFHGYSAADMSAIFVDDITLDLSPSCLEPIALTLDNVDATEATISWTPAGSETNWNIEYGEAGFTPGTGTQDVTTTPEYTAQDLTANTDYEFYVQTDCGSGDESLWAGPFAFTTACDGGAITAYPWIENFDSEEIPEMPCGWSVENVNADAYTWQTYDYAANSGDQAMYIRWNAGAAMNDWAYTPELEMQAGQTYHLSFNLTGSGTTFPEKLTVSLGQTASEAGMTTQLLDLPNIVNDLFELQEVDITVPTTGSYYIGFHGHSDANMFFIAIDDVSITTCDAEDASFTLADDTLCTNGTIVTPVVTGTTGGTFSGTPGLTVDAATGAVNPATSTEGTHYIIYTSSTGECAAMDSMAVVIEICLGVDEETLAAIDVYPNPTNGFVNIVIPASTGTVNVSVVDFAGKEVMASVPSQGTVKLDFSALQNGVYFVKFQTATAGQVRRVVLNR